IAGRKARATGLFLSAAARSALAVFTIGRARAPARANARSTATARDHPTCVNPVGGPSIAVQPASIRTVLPLILARPVGGQERTRAANLGRLAPAADDCVPGVRVIDIGTRLDGSGKRGLDDRRRDRVDAHAVAAALGGEALDQQRNRSLGRTIDREPRLD